MKPIYYLIFVMCIYLFAGDMTMGYSQTILPPSQTDEIIIDNGASGKADPADRIRYTVTIVNTGGADATGMQFTAVPDPRTTLVPGSFRSSPLAVPDVYTSTGNVGITINAASGLKANDFDDNFAGLAITAGTFATANSGSIMISADGSFMYTPPPGFAGTDTYTYTLNDSNPVGGPVPATDAGTISITVSNLIWFIDNSAAAGDGRLATPFNSLTAFNSGSAAAGDVVYVAETGTAYTGVITLQNGERLYGEGHTGGANLANVLPFTLVPNSKALPNINSTRPIITNAAGNGIVLAMNNTVRGINVANTTGTDISGANFGTLTLSEVLLSGTGQALNLASGTLAATFDGVTSTSSTTQGIIVSGAAGTLTLGSTAISGSTTQGILIGTSTANINFGNTTVSAGTDGVSLQNNSSGTRTFGTLSITNGSGTGFLHGAGGGLTNVTGTTTITNPGGRGIDIQNTATLNGVTFVNVTANQSGGTGVHLQNNAGNITFADLDIAPDAGQRSLNATENSGSITTTSGTFLNSGAIGVEITKTATSTPLAMVLTSVSSSGSTHGINLLRTSGSFAINGTGTTNASGGTILNMSARGAAFTNATNITLKNMAFTNANTTDAGTCGASDNSGCNAAIYLNTVTNSILDNVDISGTTTQQGINAREVDGLKLLNSTILNAGVGGSEEGGLYALNLFGLVEITNTSITFPAGRGVTIYNISKTLTLDVTGSNFDDTQTSAVGADGFEISTFGTSNTTIDILNSLFRRNKTNGLQTIAEDNSFMSLDIQGSTFDYGNNPGGGGGIDIDAADNGDVDFNIINNPLFRGGLTSIVNFFAQGNSTMEGRFNNNTVQSGGGSGTGIRAVAQESSDMKIEINGNTVSGISLDNGIDVISRAGDGRMDAIISNNNVSIVVGANAELRTAAGASGSTFTNKTCAYVHHNTVTNNGFSTLEGRVVNAHELILQGGGANMIANWNTNLNLPASPPSIINPLISGAGVISFAGTCTAPANPVISF